MPNIKRPKSGKTSHRYAEAYAIITETIPASEAAKITPIFLCLKLPGMSLGELNKAPIARTVPISKFPNPIKIPTGEPIATVSTIALEKSVLLRYFRNSCQ